MKVKTEKTTFCFWNKTYFFNIKKSIKGHNVILKKKAFPLYRMLMFKTYLTGKQTFDKNEIGLSRLTFFFFLTSNFAFKLNTGVFGFSLNTPYKKCIQKRTVKKRRKSKGKCAECSKGATRGFLSTFWCSFFPCTGLISLRTGLISSTRSRSS